MEARPAEPLLASSLIKERELEGLVEGLDVGGSKKGRGGDGGGVRLGIGKKDVDDGVLGGGVLRGNVIGIWGDGAEVCRALLVDSLLKSPGSMAAVVDTTGNFDVVKLYTDILERMRKVPELIEELQAVTDSKEGDTTEDVAAKVLDQVKIMRVFDFVGVREAIGEIRDDLEGKRSANRKRQTAEGKPEAVKRLLTPKRPTPEPLTPEPLPKRTVVADSEDEDDEEEMLFDTVELVEEVLPVPPIPSLQPEADTAEAREVQEFQDEETSSKVRFILIDNLAQALNPLLKKDYIQANALASIFLQALNHLTRTHALHTILANPATPPRPTSSPTRQPPNQGPLPPEHTKQQPPPPPSIFASNGLVPSLKGVLARYVDVSLLVSQLPKKKKDAKVYYHDENAGATKKLRGVEMVSVLEIISDRWESRVGAWASL